MPSRRDFLTSTLAGGAGVGLATGLLLEHYDRSSITVDSMQSLRRLSPPASGSVAVHINGYYAPGDGGHKTMFWDSQCQLADNRGTVIASAYSDKGRWRQLHNGELNFRQFGIFDADSPADDALDAMINDADVLFIKATTPLNFIRRHMFCRSGITLDFGHQTITAKGIEDADKESPWLDAVLQFSGQVTGKAMTVTLMDNLAESEEVFPVPEAQIFLVGRWYLLESGLLAGKAERVIQRLVRVTEVINDRYVRINYKSGYALTEGSSLTWVPISPVKDVNIMNMHFSSDGTTESDGSHPVAFEYAVNCNVSNIHAVGAFWPVVFRRWNTTFKTEHCSLLNPPIKTTGGAGYLTQNIYCLYGHISNCTADNARHLTDFTASSGCLVENCHATGDSEGAFNTHGQYEHDISFFSNSGIFALANSGRRWGLSARRIYVENHICNMLLADTFVTDLTLNNVHISRVPGTNDPGILRVNLDGLSVTGCSVDGEVTFSGHSTFSKRRNIIEGCGFALDDINGMTIPPYPPGLPPLSLVKNSVNGANALTFRTCTFTGAKQGTRWRLRGQDMHFYDCNLTEMNLVLDGGEAQRIVFSGFNELTGKSSSSPLLSRAGEQLIVWHLTGLSGYVSMDEATHIVLDAGENHLVMNGCIFAGGQCLFRASAFPAGTILQESNNIFIQGARVEWPTN